MRAVNLLPRQHVEQVVTGPGDGPNPVPVVAAVGGGAVVLALAGGFLLASRSVDHQREALAAAKAQLAATPAKVASAKVQAHRATLLSDRERRALALASALGKRVSWDRVLRRVTLVLPDDVWLTNLSGAKPLTEDLSTEPAAPTGAETSIPAAPTALTLQGYTYSQDGVARLLSRLEVVPDLRNVQLQTSKVAKVGNRDVINFTIISDVHNGGEAS